LNEFGVRVIPSLNPLNDNNASSPFGGGQTRAKNIRETTLREMVEQKVFSKFL
jgi:hypothetical protein